MLLSSSDPDAPRADGLGEAGFRRAERMEPVRFLFSISARARAMTSSVDSFLMGEPGGGWKEDGPAALCMLDGRLPYALSGRVLGGRLL